MARILVIEDEAALRSIMRRVLVGAGYEVVEAGAARAACEALRTIAIDLVLADLCLSGQVHEGLSAMAEIRRSHPRIPLIAMSGRHREEILERLDAMGLRDSVGVLTKPFAPEELLAVVRAALTASARDPGG